ncbi:tripartite motif-containing protein 2-like [Centruroides vittatus]|uniref:tripartite motif-containing protein 2-like n=1 Tax=Centruroides vittatus TaxID=120091 RepID=UPI00350ED978
MAGLINRVAECSISEASMADLFCCTICFNQFDEAEYLPKLLSCHHTFCRKCLSILHEQNQNTLICPVCSAECRIGRKGIDGLSTNYYLYKFTDLLNNLKLDQGDASSSDQSSPEICQKHGNTVKYFWCVTCSRKICIHCLGVDHNVAKGHNVKDLTEAIKSIQNDVLMSIRGVKLKISRIQELQFQAEMTDKNMETAVATLHGMYKTPFKCFQDIFTESRNPEKILASVNEFCSSEKFKCNPESLVTMKHHLEEVLTYYCSIEEFLEQKLEEMKILQKSKIFVSVVRPEN